MIHNQLKMDIVFVKDTINHIHNQLKEEILNSELEQILPNCFRINKDICNKYDIHTDFNYNYSRISVFDEIFATWIDLELTPEEIEFVKLKYGL